MSPKPNNPPLFEQMPWTNMVAGEVVDEEIRVTTSITLRDLFAAFALVPLVQHHLTAEDYPPGEVAEDAYTFADAMLAAREAKTDE